MGFCQNCGGPLAAGASFCTRCGAPAGAPAPAATPSAPPPAKGSGIGRILLIAAAVIAVLGVLALGGLIVTGIWIKKKVETAAERVGISSVPSSASRARRVSDPCALLPAGDAARITGFTVERAERNEDSCIYFGSAGQAAARGQAQAEEAMNRMRSNKVRDEKEAARTMEDFMKGIAAAGNTSQGGQMLRVTVKYGDEARQEESAVRLALGLMGAPQGAKGAPVEGVGDRAYLLPMAVGLHMAKGDAYVMIEGPAAPSRETLIAVAQAIAGRL